MADKPKVLAICTRVQLNQTVETSAVHFPLSQGPFYQLLQRLSLLHYCASQTTFVSCLSHQIHSKTIGCQSFNDNILNKTIDNNSNFWTKTFGTNFKDCTNIEKQPSLEMLVKYKNLWPVLLYNFIRCPWRYSVIKHAFCYMRVNFFFMMHQL